MFIAESEKVVLRALTAGYQPISLLCEKRHVTEQLLSLMGDIPVYVGEEQTLRSITGYALTGGVLCAMRRKPLSAIQDICRGAKRVAVLEGVVNPTNVGAVFRSAAAMGIDAVLLSPACCDPLYRRAIRVSMGNVFHIPWTYTAKTEQEWQENSADILHALGFKTAALALRENTLDVRDERLRAEPRLAVMLGAEGEGLSDRTISLADYSVKIPMTNGVDSLNVAAASAVAFWELAMRTREV